MWRKLAVCVGLLLSSVGARAEQNAHDELERRITSELREKDARMLDAFAAANRAREKADHSTAERLYAEVFARVPTFYHAERRRCGELLRLERRDEAVALCRDAAEKEATAPNLTALASAILSKPGRDTLTDSELDEANQLLTRAEQLDPRDESVALTQCQLALQRKNLPELRSCSARLEQLAPSDPRAAWANWMLAMADGRFDDAEAQVERARNSGATPEMVAEMAEGTRQARPWTDRAWYWSWRVVVAWAALALLLVIAGSALSRLTLRTAENWSPESARRGATLRSIYRGVLVVCSLLYYVSLPLALLGVVALAGGLIYGMFAVGYVSIKLGLLAIVMMFATGAAIVKSLTLKPSDAAPGIPVDLATEPELRATLEEVAAQIGTRPVDRVYMTPDTSLAVFERKGGVRCLIVGAAVLEGMPLTSFKAILAHEYGHFSNRDTAGGGFALGVRRSLMLFIIGLAESGHATPWNPAWWFARAFYAIFLRVSQGASRLQEILADRRAAEAYGGAAFATGLKHVLACELRFEDHVSGAIDRTLKAREPLTGLFSPLAERHPDVKELSEALNREPSPYDSHPSPRDRIRWVEHLSGAVTPSGSAESPAEKYAWDIFESRARHEREVTLFVYQRLAESGVHPPALPAEPTG